MSRSRRGCANSFVIPAEALNDDENYAATIQNQLATKQNNIDNVPGTNEILFEKLDSPLILIAIFHLILMLNHLTLFLNLLLLIVDQNPD